MTASQTFDCPASANATPAWRLPQPQPAPQPEALKAKKKPPEQTGGSKSIRRMRFVDGLQALRLVSASKGGDQFYKLGFERARVTART